MNAGTAPRRCDVAILGGGLAGLTLAVQLRREHPGISVVVLERRAHPVPEAAFKVGESTVEIGAHYLADVLGLREHLESRQVRKFGFRFFFSEGSHAIDRCTELGVTRLLPVPSWQLDRGRFENFLGEHAGSLGATFLDGATVRGIALADGDGDHVVRFEHAGTEHALEARWVVDASGRAGLLKRKLGLAQGNGHDANSAWWRVDGCVDPHAWSDDPAWLGRCTPPERWRSTNHLCGPGYWVWMIPLASGAHSVGIVCDAQRHPLGTMDTHAKAMDWLRAHQPQFAAQLDDPRHGVQDFRFLRGFSYGCKQVFSAQRWALTGESGVFLDPFYSPGTDFIAIANTYICELVARDHAGGTFGAYADLFQQLYFSFYESTLSLYQDQYALFGDVEVMPVKVTWDYTFYWSLLAPLFFAGKLADVSLLGRLRPQFERSRALNDAMQPLLRDWGRRNLASAAGSEVPHDGRMLDQYQVGWFRELNGALDEAADDAELVDRIVGNVERMDWLAGEILGRARAAHAGIDDHGLNALLAERAPGQAMAPASPALWYESAA